MGITCEIYPELNVIIYVCTGILTPTDFFHFSDLVLLDPRFKEDMKTILDFSDAAIDTAVSDLHLAITKYQEANRTGKRVGQTAILTTNAAMQFLGDALRLLSFDTVTNFSVFYTAPDAAQWLNLPKQKLLPVWQELKAKARTNPQTNI